MTSQQLVIYASSFVYYFLLIRVLNAFQIGEISLLAAVSAGFTTVTQLALPLAATRFISSRTGGKYPTAVGPIARTTLRLIVSISLPVLALSLYVSPWIATVAFKDTNAFSFLVVAFTASFLLDLTTLSAACFLGLGQYAEMTYQGILYHPLSRGLGLILAYEGLGPLGIPVGWGIGALATLILSLYLLRGKLPGGSEFPPRTLLAFSLPLFATSLVTLLQNWGDITLLQGLIGKFSLTGAYYLTVTSVSFLSILWNPAASALYPALSSSYSNESTESVCAKLGQAMRMVNLTVLPSGIGLAAIAGTALTAIYGNQLEAQALPFSILAIAIIFSAQSVLMITTLQAIGKTAHILIISIAATAVDLVTVVVGAPIIGVMAGALGRALLAVTMTALTLIVLRRTLHVPISEGLPKGISLATLSAVPLLIVDKLLNANFQVSPTLRLIALAILFFSVYLAASRALLVFDELDFEILENAAPRFGGPIRMLRRFLVRG